MKYIFKLFFLLIDFGDVLRTGSNIYEPVDDSLELRPGKGSFQLISMKFFILFRLLLSYSIKDIDTSFFISFNSFTSSEISCSYYNKRAFIVFIRTMSGIGMLSSESDASF